MNTKVSSRGVGISMAALTGFVGIARSIEHANMIVSTEVVVFFIFTFLLLHSFKLFTISIFVFAYF